MQKRRIEISPSESPNIFNIGKRTFVLKEQKMGKDGHIKKLIFEQINKREHMRNLEKLTEEIFKSKEVDVKTVLHQTLINLSIKDLEELKKSLKGLKKPKMKKGCLEIDIDGVIIPIFERASFLD